MLTTIYLCSTKHFRLIPLIEHQNHDGHIILSCFVISQLIKEILKEGDDCFFLQNRTENFTAQWTWNNQCIFYTAECHLLICCKDHGRFVMTGTWVCMGMGMKATKALYRFRALHICKVVLVTRSFETLKIEEF